MIDPSLEEKLLAESLQHDQQVHMDSRERVGETLAAAGFLLAVVGLLLLRPPGSFALAPVALCVVVMALAANVRFDTPLGFTVATQLAFVPLFFLLPVALVPVAVVVALALAQLGNLGAERPSARGLLLVLGNSWFAVGPAALFILTDTSPRHAGPVLLVAALAAQFLVDFLASTARFAFRGRVSLATQLRDAWVYGIDAALSPIPLLLARDVHSPSVVLALVPLLALLAVFAQERRRRMKSLLELNTAYRGTALVLGNVLESDDGYTGEHSRGVVALALAVAERVNLSPDRRRNLEFAALLHDVGKIAIPKQIINKPGQLDRHEWTIIKTHTIEGQRMLDQVGGFMRQVGLIVRSHHERWDGGGYPDGLAGAQIPLEARIISCCDTWNAMRTDRPYREALTTDAAIAELNAVSGSQLDPRIVDALIEVLNWERAEDPAVLLTEDGDLRVAAGPPELRPTAPPVLSTETDALVVAVLNGGEHVRNVEDARSNDPAERLLEESWNTRWDPAARRELLSETLAAVAFLAIALPWALTALARNHVSIALIVLLVGLYAVASRAVKYPVGAGYAVPSYLILVPMLLLLPPGSVPLLAATGLVLGTLVRVVTRLSRAESLLFSIADAWYTFGPALVLALWPVGHGVARLLDYLAAFLAGCLVDLIASSVREALATGIAPRLQARVIASIWMVDAFLAPGGLLAALAARHHPVALLLLLPVIMLLALVARDRNARIAEAQHRLGLVAQERTRLQAAVHRLGEAFTARLELRALTDVVLGGALDATDADAGRLTLRSRGTELADEYTGARDLQPLVDTAVDAVTLDPAVRQLERSEAWALALPFAFAPDGGGALAVVRRDRPFRADEEALLTGLVKRAEGAVVEILANDAMRQEALTDPLTGLGNRRSLSEQLARQLATSTPRTPLMLMLFDLDGFKSYNDSFGHPAGDALLARLGHRLAASVGPLGTAYRLGGDEFCALVPAGPAQLETVVAAAVSALHERGEKFNITTSCGTVLLPHEANSADYALQLADKRMYARKHGRRSGAREQAQDLLFHIIKTKQPELSAHASGVARLAVPIGHRLGMTAEQLDELGRAAALHDVGNVAIPDTILSKPGPLDEDDWALVHQHTILGERILSVAPALRPIATIVRASHERWDGTGYPDGLRGTEIPAAARVIAVCDAYLAMTTDQSYRRAATPAAARAELQRESGKQFDPEMVDALLDELDHPQRQSQAPPATADQLIAEVVSQARELLSGAPAA